VSSQESGLRSKESGLHGQRETGDTAIVRTYGQYCPIARGAEIFAERWTPLIIRNLYLGCETFGEILDGAPGLSRTLLAQRLRQLERLGIVESAPKAHERGDHYGLTDSGHDLLKVCVTLGEWGPVGARSPPRTSTHSSRSGVGACGLRTDTQRSCHLACGRATGDEDEDLQLTWRQPRRAGLPPLAGRAGGSEYRVRGVRRDAPGADLGTQRWRGRLAGCCGSVRARFGHCAVDVGGGEDACGRRDRRSRQATVVARAVHSLVGERGDRAQPRQRLRPRDHPV
jgi:DNA-binding HxlR family transcriptional regulator